MNIQTIILSGMGGALIGFWLNDRTARRNKAAMVAEFLAEWPYNEARKLNRLSYEMSLWMPKWLYRKFVELTGPNPNEMKTHELLITVRDYLKPWPIRFLARMFRHLTLSANDIRHWEKQ